MRFFSFDVNRRRAIATIASFVASVTLAVTPPLATSAFAVGCAPTTTDFVGGGTSDISSATFGTAGVNYTELRFTSTSDCDWIVPSGVTEIDIVLVGGGGGGGSGSRAGGGGAGELAYKDAYAVTPESSISVSVGSGGIGGVDGVSAAESGSSSTFGAAVALGGGRGGGNVGASAETGGSSGGARGFSTAVAALAATTTVDALAFTRLANNGGGTDGSSYGTGGGGAGGAAFATATIYSADPSTQPNGGDSFTIFGHELAGGGSGWAAGAYVSSGGGEVGGSNFPVEDPVANTGSGSAAAATPAGASPGADGVVIVRFVTPTDDSGGGDVDGGGEDGGDGSTSTPPTTNLANTGFDAFAALGIGIVAVLVGAGALRFSRRRA